VLTVDLIVGLGNLTGEREPQTFPNAPYNDRSWAGCRLIGHVIAPAAAM